MTEETIVRRYKDFDVIAHQDGSAKIVTKDGQETNFDSFAWMQLKDSITKGTFEFPKKRTPRL